MCALGELTGPQLQTVLFADVHGYTRLLEQDERGTLSRLTRSMSLIRGLIGNHGGAVVNTAGDGLVATFDDARDAMDFAMEMQAAMAREAAGPADGPAIRYRIGIAVGEVFAGADGVYGRSVNLAARIQSLAEPGGICVTAEVHRILRDDPRLRFRRLGARQLRNMSGPVEILAVTCALARPAVALPPLPRRAQRQGRALPDASLAILPMDNLAGAPDDQYLCQGLAADLITSLSRFRNLMVIARHSSALVAAEAHSLREIGRKLGVRYLLTGSLRRIGNRIRISVNLVEAASETVLWSESHDGILAELPEFMDEVAACTAARVATHIDASERRRLVRQSRPATHAYGLVLRGQDLEFRFVPAANLRARRLFEQAHKLDPGYARSYAAMSRTFNVEWRYNWTDDPTGAQDQALALAKRAVECDHLDARGFAELGLAHLYKKQHDEAVAAYEHALELNPNDADLLAHMGDCLAYVRQGKRAVQLLERAIRLNPYHPDSYLWFLGDAYFHMGDYESTLAALYRMRDQSEAHRLLAASHAMLGQMDEARRHAGAVMRVHPNFSLEHWRKVPPLRHAEDLAPYVEGLRMAGLN